MNKIVETFYSIQGEGKYSGTPAYFIRFYKCNLTCDFGNGFVCDDKAHSNKELVVEYSDEELVTMAVNLGAKHVVLTGGEVSLHDVNKLITKLQSKGIVVQVETNGTNLENIRLADYITYSPKSEFSSNAPTLQSGFHELKLLAGVDNPVDVKKWETVNNKYVQPIGYDSTWNMFNVDYCINFVKENPTWKLSVQVHKILGVR